MIYIEQSETAITFEVSEAVSVVIVIRTTTNLGWLCHAGWISFSICMASERGTLIGELETVPVNILQITTYSTNLNWNLHKVQLIWSFQIKKSVLGERC